MYTPELSTASGLAATGLATAWYSLAAGVLIMAGATLVTIVGVVRHRAKNR